jgi:hypothetical protein
VVSVEGTGKGDVVPKIQPELWYNNKKLSSIDTLTANRKLTTPTYTSNWLAKMGVAISGVGNRCEEEMRIKYILYTCTKFDPPANHRAQFTTVQLTLKNKNFAR